MPVPDRLALDRGGGLIVATHPAGDTVEVTLELEGVGEPCVLHWGVTRGARRWQTPAPSDWPAGSRASQGAVDSPFPDHPNTRRLTLPLHSASEDAGLDFVLFRPASGRWDNNSGRDYRVSVQREGADGGSTSASSAALDDLAATIVERETGRHSWTLMHRFDLCHDLLDRVPPNWAEGLALLFAWLRFSAIRQLDWQRNYNTKPRELAHAQDRLTLKLAARFAREPGERPWLRLLLGTLGRGGEGQRVRDEVLNIMHRHHIKEASGHFMEEWHQKLHNNTTPDDVVICDAYLAFLRSDGDRRVFYAVLERGGVTRARLQGYERPIRSDPDFIPHLKDALVHDFEEFRRVLGRLHSGTDLDAALDGAQHLLGGELRGLTDWIRHHRDKPGVLLDELVDGVTRARRGVAGPLGSANDAGQVRAWLYLDLALEELVRLAVERRIHQPPPVEQMVRLVALSFENVRLSDADAEIDRSANDWRRVAQAARDDLWPLRAEATIERAGRAVASLMDRWREALQPVAERLGRAFGADAWAIGGFSEEVVRGRPMVTLPVLGRLLRQAVREQARLPPWQVVSRGSASGVLHVVDGLAHLPRHETGHPVVALAATLGGQEDIPGGVAAVITTQDVDVLSHLAIRARNAGVLLASCHDGGEIDRLRALDRRPVSLTIGAGGDVIVREGPPAGAAPPTASRRAARLATPGQFAGYAVGEDRFDEQRVGRKALGLARLRGRLPSWIRLPRSVAVPFGAMERALADPLNATASRRYDEATHRLAAIAPGDRALALALAELRGLVATLGMPPAFAAALHEAFEHAGFAWPGDERAWRNVAAVWASKWNERAFTSRRASGISDAALAMAVLVQRVVEADYAFVIHTTNPFTGAAGELYAEVVRGLGETLVGNHPGRALGFTWRKANGPATLRTLPSKSVGLFGGGLIFRSDSNAEDLEGYAGAGLYDSVMLDAPREVPLDYAAEPLDWDDGFRNGMLEAIARIGLSAEEAAGSPQDVEGARAGDEWFLLQSRPQVG